MGSYGREKRPLVAARVTSSPVLPKRVVTLPRVAPLEQELDVVRIVAAITGFGWRALDPGGGRVQLADFELLDGLDLRVGLLECSWSTNMIACCCCVGEIRAALERCGGSPSAAAWRVARTLLRGDTRGA
jgi:hypothetical protein